MRKILTNFLASLFIFLVNLGLVWPLFLGGYTQQMGSIESVFIAEARFLSQNWPHLSWNPTWYAGFPFYLFYTPFLQFLMVLGQAIFSFVSLASWYRILIGVFYALTPVSLYFLVSFLTKKKRVGFFAALFYSFVPTLGYLMPQMGGLAGIYDRPPWRLLTMILYGEGSHMVALCFLPLALIFFIKATRQASWVQVALASFLTGLVAMTNLIALFGFLVMLAVALLAELLEGDWWRKLCRAGMVSLFSFGLVAFWFNFSFLKNSFAISTGALGESMKMPYRQLLPLLFLMPPFLFALAMAFRIKVLKPILIALCWVLIFFLAAFFWFNGETMLLPQPNRYFPEMDMGVALMVAWGVYLLIEKITPPKLKLFKSVFYLLMALLIPFFALRYINQVWDLTAPQKKIEASAEFRVASWLKNHLEGERVYASGSTAFWLNVFTDVAQVRGGNDSLANPWILHAVHQINTGENAPKGKEGEIALNWLRSLNVAYLVVNLPSSKGPFHDFLHPEKFTKIKGFEEEVNLDGDVIYKVALNQPALAQVVKKETFAGLQEPKNAVDVERLKKYADYIDHPQFEQAEFVWTGIGRARIKAKIAADEGLGVQISGSPGWRAYLDQKQIQVKKDILGFIYLEPPKTGEVEIELVYHRTFDVWLGYFLTLLTLGALAVYPKLASKAAKFYQRAEKEWEKEE